MDERILKFLYDIQQCISKIETYTEQQTQEAYLEDEKTQDNDTLLLVADERRGPIVESLRWRDLNQFVDFAPPDIGPAVGEEFPRSDEFGAAWASALRRASIVFAAEAFAAQMNG